MIEKVKHIKCIKLSAPGKLVIAGEHAVMHGYSSISMAINQKMFVKIQPIFGGKKVNIKSNVFGKTEFYNGEILQDWSKPISFLVKELSKYGLKITIKSKIKNYGFGSSGALFICIAFGLLKINNIENEKDNLNDEEYFYKIMELYKKYHLQHKNDNFMSSGVDIATSFFGGLIYFSPNNCLIEKLNNNSFAKNITAIYTGHKTSTMEVVSAINKAKNADVVYEKIGNLVNKLKTALNNHNNEDINILLKQNQLLLKELNIVDSDIEHILNQCNEQQIVAKISGSGLGDCVIAFKKNVKVKNHKSINVKSDNNGLTYKMCYQ